MAETPGNRHNRHMGGYHQAGVGVAQAVDCNRWQIVLYHEFREPCRYFVQIQRRTIPPGEKQVIRHSPPVLYLHYTSPDRARFQAQAALIELVFLQHIKAVRTDLECTV